MLEAKGDDVSALAKERARRIDERRQEETTRKNPGHSTEGMSDFFAGEGGAMWEHALRAWKS